MADQKLICPHCHKEIPLTEALSHQIGEKVRAELTAANQAKEQEIAQREQALSTQMKALKDSQQSLQEEVNRRVQVEQERILAEAKKKAEENVSLKIQDMQNQLTETGMKLEQAQKNELDLRKQQRELEASKKALELEVIRRIDEERTKIQEQAAQQVEEEHRMKDLEKDKKLDDMRRQIDDLKRKAEQGSQQTQGEVLELNFEELLKTTFPADKIEPVEKGQRGADIIQNVSNDLGQFCGTIIWETKQTKNWSGNWLEKLKNDQREVKADLAILLTTAMPKEIKDFGLVDGVWVTSCSCAIGLAMAMRMNLIQIARIRQAEVGRHDKMSLIYNYLCGQEFKQRVEGIVEAFNLMQESLEKEKVAMTKIWAQREKQISQVINNTVGMYGDVQGIIGASLPQIEAIELKALPAGGGDA